MFSLESEVIETNIQNHKIVFYYTYTLFFVIPVLLVTVKVII